MTRAGDLRTVASFQSRTESTDSYGMSTVTWGTAVKVQCQFVSGSGRELLRNGRLEPSIVATLRVRQAALPSVNESWRVTIDSVVWNIRSVMRFGQRKEWLDIMIERATSGVAV
jgi:SPP1 family predicted phage head-tail adaptor